MKNFHLFLTICLGFIASAAFAQPEGETEPGKCYAKCVIPDQYETITEQVLVKEGVKKWEVIPAVYETVTEEVMLEPKSTRLIPVPAEFETVTETIVVKEESQRIIYVPAEYETVTQEIRVKDQSSRAVPVSAQFETVTESYVKKAAATRIEVLQPKFENVTQTIEVSPATTKWVKRKADKNCLSANPEDCLVWCLVEVPAQYRTVTTRKNIGCDGSGVPNQGCIVETPIAEEVATRSYKKLVNDATYNDEKIDAEYKTVSIQKVVKPATTRTEVIPAVTKTITKRVLKNPATVREEVIPAKYGTITRRKLVSPATYKEVDIDPVYETISKRKLVKAGGFTEWREILCDSDVTNYTVRQIQKALIDRGYDVGPAGTDNILGADTKAALQKFQKDNGLPVGNLDFETLKALGIQY